MTTGNTTLLGLALPVEGELDGTWGDVVNDSITSLVDSAVAGTTTLSVDADVTLTDTALSANQARQAVILWTASNGATTRNITAPARSKPYIVINAGTGSVVLRGAGPTTGITIISGEKCLAAWNGSDFVKIATSNTTTGTVTSVGGTGTVNGITLTGTVTSSGNLTLGGALSGVGLSTQVTGTLPVANGGTGATTLTANNVLLGNGTSALQVVAPGSNGNVLTSNGTTWQSVAAPTANIVRVARTSNTALTSANKSNLIAITSGTFSQTFDACSSLGDGWFCYIQNAGTGDITLDPNGSETIDGLTSYVMYPGEVRLVQCDGTALRSIVLNAFFCTFTASGTFTKPPGYAAFSGLLWGGGGSGGKSNSLGISAGGGGGGACVPFVLQSSTVSASTTVTIGSGGTARSTEGAGNSGGTSSFGALVTSYGGGGGGGQSTDNSGGGGGGGALGAGNPGSPFASAGGSPAKTPTSNSTISNEGFGGGGSNGSGSPGGAAAYGGAAGGSGSQLAGQALYGGGGGGGGGGSASSGGASTYGGPGSFGSISGTAPTATAPGGGGGGTGTGTSGAGARGELRIWGVI